jgi:hypothetical protein
MKTGGSQTEFGPLPCSLDPSAVDVAGDRLFHILVAQKRPLTARQAASLSELPLRETTLRLERMRDAGLVRRLNTVIESYTAEFR